MQRNYLIGVGEAGSALCDLMQEAGEPFKAVDKIHSRCREFGEAWLESNPELLHIAIPYQPLFESIVVSSAEQLRPKQIIIHSTVKPHTSSKIQSLIGTIPVIYSPIRGVHAHMLDDLKRYSKFFAYAKSDVKIGGQYQTWLERVGLHGIKMRNALTLEYAKILVDTTYYGWLILYAQHTKEITDAAGINWDEMWSFSDEIHQFLGNRPKMYPGKGIGGHCLLPNIELLDDEFLNMVFSHDTLYRRKYGMQ
jgi:hypothetical protein